MPVVVVFRRGYVLKVYFAELQRRHFYSAVPFVVADVVRVWPVPVRLLFDEREKDADAKLKNA